jgi:tetraacyldisaccharide 4'-kinase
MIERIWFGDDKPARAARAALVPAERVFATVAGLRTLLYDAGWVKGRSASVPVVSVGNLTVGGSGKTPIAAMIARWLRDRGARPAIVMRGYGEDEPLVHRIVNPDVDVVTGADRAAAVDEAAHRGADIAVLDDGFQHRQLRRDVDIVVISADQWTDETHMLPAGPWREPLSAVRRAQLVIVTRKAATEKLVDRVNEVLAHVAPRVPRMTMHLAPDELVRVDGSERVHLFAIAAERVTVVAGIGDPAAFFRQIESRAAGIHPIAFRDHHRFSVADVQRIVGESQGSARVIGTLKDVVKLRDLWPREAPGLWYVSQRVVVERGVGGLEQLLETALRSRATPKSPAAAGPG